MAEQTLKEKTAKGLFWGGISNGMQQLLGVLIGIVLLKNLTPDDYGMVGMLAIFTAIASTIQESGFTAALTNRPEFKAEDYNSVFWFNLVVGSVIYVFLFFSAPLIAHFYKQPELILLSRVLFLSIVIGTLGIAHNAFLFKQLMVKERAKIDIFSTLISGVFGIILALKGFGYWALAVQTLVASSMGTILRWYFSPWRPSFSFNFKPIKEMFSFSVKLLVSNVVNVVQNNIFSILLGRYYSKDILGYYTQGSKWGIMGGQMIYGMIFNVTQPMLVEVQGNRERQLGIFRKLLRCISFIACPLLIGLAFVAKEFIQIINSEFLPSILVLQIYCLIALVSAFQWLYVQTSIALGRSDFYGYATLFYAVIQILACIFVLSSGIYWLALTVLLLNCANLFVWHCFLNRILGVKFVYLIKDIFPYLLITMFVFILVWLITFKINDLFLLFISKIVLSMILYIFILWMSNSVLFKEMIRFVLKNKY